MQEEHKTEVRLLTHTLISGGMTGAERAALDVSRKISLRTGGYAAFNWRTDDGAVAPVYRSTLIQTPTSNRRKLTRRNIQASDGTVIFLDTKNRLSKHIQQTLELVQQLRVNYCTVDMNTAIPVHEPAPTLFRDWLESKGICILHVTGPRESTVPGTHAWVQDFLLAALNPGTIDVPPIS